MFVSIFYGAVVELPAWILLATGFYVSLRVLRFPDLTVEATYIAGSVGAAWGAVQFGSSLLGVVCAMCLGVLGGALTGMLYSLHRTPTFKLLASALVVFSFYSINFRLLGRRPDQGFLQAETSFNWLRGYEVQLGVGKWAPISITVSYLLVLGIVLLLWVALRSEFGFVLRSIGHRPNVVRALGKSVALYTTAGLVVANGIVAIGGWLRGTVNASASIGGFGIIIHALAAVLLGEIMARAIFRQRATSMSSLLLRPVIGAVIYAVVRSIVTYMMSEAPGIGDVHYLAPIPQDLNLIFALILVLLLILPKGAGAVSDTDELEAL